MQITYISITWYILW